MNLKGIGIRMKCILSVNTSDKFKTHFPTSKVSFCCLYYFFDNDVTGYDEACIMHLTP